MMYSLPITKSGKSAIVQPPPYVYAVDYIAVYVKINEEIANSLLPPGLELASDNAWIYVSEFLSYPEHHDEITYQDPELTVYREGAVALNVILDGQKYLYFPFMWVDKDWALIRGYINGYPKKIANISLSKFHPLMPGREGPAPGVKLGGYVARNGYTLYRIEVELRDRTNSLPITAFGPTLTIRRYPATGSGQRDVWEYVTVIKGESKTADIWTGRGFITIGWGPNDEVNLLQIKEVIGGYFYRSYFKILGTKLIKTIEDK